MKTWRWVFLSCMLALFWLLSSVGEVAAQDPTETPTPAPLYLTATPVTVYDGLLPCPSGNPIGWGIVTPSPRWLQLCGHCVDFTDVYETVEPISTPGVYPTGTAAAWVTPQATSVYSDPWSSTPTVGPTETPVLTPTPMGTPEVEFTVRDSDGGSIITRGEWQYVSCTDSNCGIPFYVQAVSDGCDICIDLEFGGSVVGGRTLYFWRDTVGVDLWWSRNKLGTGNASIEWDHTGQDPQSGSGETPPGDGGSIRIGQAVYAENEYGALDVEFDGIARFCVLNTHETRPGFVELRMVDAAYWQGTGVLAARWISATGSFEGLATPTPEPTGTPAPTATTVPDNDYCFEVEPIDEDWLGIELPSFGIGHTTCAGIDAQNFSIPVIGDVNFPGISVCFHRIEFGVVDVIGVQIDIDILAALAAGVSVLRLLLRS